MSKEVDVSAHTRCCNKKSYFFSICGSPLSLHLQSKVHPNLGRISINVRQLRYFSAAFGNFWQLTPYRKFISRSPPQLEMSQYFCPRFRFLIFLRDCLWFVRRPSIRSSCICPSLHTSLPVTKLSLLVQIPIVQWDLHHLQDQPWPLVWEFLASFLHFLFWLHRIILRACIHVWLCRARDWVGANHGGFPHACAWDLVRYDRLLITRDCSLITLYDRLLITRDCSWFHDVSASFRFRSFAFLIDCFSRLRSCALTDSWIATVSGELLAPYLDDPANFFVLQHSHFPLNIPTGVHFAPD